MSALLYTIQSMTAAHAEGILQIYREGIETGISTFETVCPNWETFDKRFLPVCRLVAESHLGEIAGWVALTAITSRSAYCGVAELSIYVGSAFRGQGIGIQLLEALIRSSEEAGFWTLQATVFVANQSSLRLHQKAGFRIVGQRERIAKRDGIWHDTYLLERRSPNIF